MFRGNKNLNKYHNNIVIDLMDKETRAGYSHNWLFWFSLYGMWAGRQVL